MKYFVFIFIILISISAYTSSVYALEEATDQLSDQLSGKDDDPNEPWHIAADEIIHDHKKDRYFATGNVVLTKKDRKLTADFVRLDHKNMILYATGHIIMTTGEDILSGTSLEMNLETETGRLYDGTIFFSANHFYIKGNKIEKVGKDSYTADKAIISTCDGDRPAWKITGKNLKVTFDGYGHINYATLWAKNIPVLYSPFLVFPVKLKRQSGFLPPQMGSSDRKGLEYIQPYFWAIDKSSDMTFYEHYMEERGNKFGLEYRYCLDADSKGTIMYDFLDDRKVDDGTLVSNEEWGYQEETGTDVLRPNSDRYWFRVKHDQALPNGFSARLDIDIVSDQDYLTEFRDGYTGFDQTEAYYLENFGREFDDYNDPIRVNTFNIGKAWPTYSLNAAARWYDAVIIRRQEEQDTTLQYMPIVEFNASKQQVLKTPFYFDFDSEYTYLYEEDGIKGHRSDLHPRVYIPVRYQNYFTFEPSAGVRGTAWAIDHDQETATDSNYKLYRTIYNTKLDLSTQLYRVYDVKGKTIDRIKHSVTPQIVHDYIPPKEQGSYPYFDDIDRIERKNLITYSITNTFTSKSKKHTRKDKTRSTVLTDDNENPENENPEDELYTYREFCRFKVQQSYDIDEAIEDNPSLWNNGVTREPFSSIYGELEFTPNSFFVVSADAQWSHYENRFVSRNTAIRLSDNRKDGIFVEHRKIRKTSESIYTKGILKITDRLSAYIENERNIYDRETIMSSVGFLYEGQCWSLEVNLTEEPDDNKIVFMINLYGLGGIGSGFGVSQHSRDISE